jgi:hypothetical protein
VSADRTRFRFGYRSPARYAVAEAIRNAIVFGHPLENFMDSQAIQPGQAQRQTSALPKRLGGYAMRLLAREPDVPQQVVIQVGQRRALTPPVAPNLYNGALI